MADQPTPQDKQRDDAQASRLLRETLSSLTTNYELYEEHHKMQAKLIAVRWKTLVAEGVPTHDATTIIASLGLRDGPPLQ